MEPISDQTYELIDRLYEPSSIIRRLIRPRAETEEIISRIAAAGEPASIFYLLPFVLDDVTVAEAAAQAIRQILDTVPALSLVQLDHWARDMGPDRRDLLLTWERWGQLRATHLPHIGRLSEGWAVLAMATFHRSGYVREAALQQLDAAPAGKIFPFLLLRLNDWVNPVRHAAEAALEMFTRTPEPEALVSALPLLLHVQSWGRRDFQPLVASLLQLLQQPGSREALSRGLESTDRHVRRECFRLALSAPGLPSAEASRVIECGLADIDVLIRLQAARRLRMLDDASLWYLSAVACADRSMPVRREALDALAARFSAEVPQVLQEALLDPHASLREWARYRLKQQPGNFDPTTFYRDALQNQSAHPLRAAILGLGETGSAEDTHRLLPFRAHALVKIREATVRALGRLDPENSIDVILTALADPSPRVSKQARRVLEEQKTLPIHDWLWDVVLHESHPIHGRLNALHVVSTWPRWPRLPFLLRALRAADVQVADAAKGYVYAWLATRGRAFLRPSPEHVAEIEAEIEPDAGALDPAVLGAIQDELTFWRRIG
jgi:HEAT repeat protein